MPAKKGTYKIDPRHRQIIFEIQHMGLSDFFGRFSKVSGTLFDPDAPEKSTLGTAVDMTAIDTHVPESGQGTRGLLQGRQVSGSFIQGDRDHAHRREHRHSDRRSDAGRRDQARDPERHLQGRAQSADPFQPYRIGFNATTTVKRSDFDLTHTMWSKWIADDVTLMIEAEGELQ